MDYAVLLKEIASTGVLGALLVLAIITIIYLFQALMKEKDKSSEKQERTNLVLKTVNDTMKEILLEIERSPSDAPREKKRRKS